LIVIALDPSFTCYGYSVFKEGILIDCGAWKYPSNPKIANTENNTSRIVQNAKDLIQLVKKHKPNLIVAETVAGTKSSTATKALFSLKGVIAGVAMASNTLVKYVLAQEAKKALTGNRCAEKIEVQIFAKKKVKNLTTRLKMFNSMETEAICDSISVYFTTIGKTK